MFYITPPKLITKPTEDATESKALHSKGSGKTARGGKKPYL